MIMGLILLKDKKIKIKIKKYVHEPRKEHEQNQTNTTRLTYLILYINK
jgi:hypothetical protein